MNTKSTWSRLVELFFGRHVGAKPAPVEPKAVNPLDTELIDLTLGGIIAVAWGMFLFAGVIMLVVEILAETATARLKNAITNSAHNGSTSAI